MGFVDAIVHVLNLFGTAIGLGLLAPSLAKLLWWRELKAVPWWALARWVAASCAAVTLLGLLITGHDGRMLTYAAQVLACAAALGWRGFWRGRAQG